MCFYVALFFSSWIWIYIVSFRFNSIVVFVFFLFSSGKLYQKSMALIRPVCMLAIVTYNWNVLAFIITKLQVNSSNSI